MTRLQRTIVPISCLTFAFCLLSPAAAAPAQKAEEVLGKLMTAESWYRGNKNAAALKLKEKNISTDSAMRMYNKATSALRRGDIAAADTIATQILSLLDIAPDSDATQPNSRKKNEKKRTASKAPSDYLIKNAATICDNLSATPHQREKVLRAYEKAGNYAFESALLNNFSKEQLYTYSKNNEDYKKKIDEALRFKKRGIETAEWIFEIDASESKGALSPFWCSWNTVHTGNADLWSAFHRCVNYADRFNVVTTIRVFIGEPEWYTTYSEKSDGTPVYGFSHINKMLDPIALGKNRRIIVCFYGMPTQLSANPRAMNSFGAANACYPKNFKKWKNYIKAMIAYMANRYGKESLRQWYFECWNEPEAFDFYRTKPPRQAYDWWEMEKGYTESEYMDGVTKFITMYDWTAQAVIETDSLYKIGGPGYMCSADTKFFKRNNPFMVDLVEHCAKGTNYATGKKGTRFDFLAYHVYGVASLDRFTASVVSLLRRFPELGKPELLIDEFHGVHFDSYPSLTHYEACAFLYAIDYCLKLRRDGWTISQLTYFPPLANPELLGETRNDGSTPLLHYGYSWFTWFYTPKKILPLPVFNVARMLSMMGGERIGMKNAEEADLIRGFATRDESGKVAVLLYNFDKYDITDQYSAQYTKKCVLKLSGLRYKKANLTRYRVSGNDNDFRLAWVKMGRPEAEKMTESQWKTIEHIAHLATVQEKRGLAVADGKLGFDFIMESQSVTLLVFEKE